MTTIYDDLKGRQFIKYCLSALFLILISYSALLRINDYYFVDDNLRKATGSTYFESLSRYTSDSLAKSFTLPFEYFFNLAPLSQLLCIIILAISGVALTKIITNTFTLFSVIISSTIAIYPFFFESMTYTYDALFMGLSVFFSILPFAYEKNRIIFFILTIICILGVLTTYQSSSGIYVSLLLLVFIKKYFIESSSIKNSCVFLITAISGYLFALIVYKIFIHNEFDGHVSTEMLTLSTLIPGLISNSLSYLQYGKNLLGNNYVYYFTLFAICMLPIKIAYLTSRNKLLSIVAIPPLIGLIIISSAGLPLLLQDFPLQPRYMIGFNTVITSFILILSINCFYVYKCCSTLFLVNLIALANIYGNAINDQWEYDKFRLNIAISDVSKFINDEYRLYFTGNPISTVSFNSKNKNYPIVNVLTNKSNLYSYGKDEIIKRYIPLQHGRSLCDESNNKLIFESNFHTILNNNNCFYINLKSYQKI